MTILVQHNVVQLEISVDDAQRVEKDQSNLTLGMQRMMFSFVSNHPVLFYVNSLSYRYLSCIKPANNLKTIYQIEIN